MRDEKTRKIPERSFPAPEFVSPQIQAIVAGPPDPVRNIEPTTTDELKARVAETARRTGATLP